MNRWLWLGLVWLAAMLQAYFLASLSGGSIVLNLVIIMLTVAALNRSPALALATALWGGFWLEVASATQFGTRMLFFGLWVLMLLLLKRFGVAFERTYSVVAMVGLGSLLYNLWLQAWAWLDIGGIVMSARLLQWWGIEVLLSAALAWLLYPRLKSMVTQRRL